MNFKILRLTWTQKGLLKSVSHKDFLTINNNESVFFGSKMGKTKHNHAGREIFLGSLQEIAANTSNIFFKNKHKK